MSLELIIQPHADADVQAIFEFISQSDTAAALRWYHAFLNAARRTLHMPDSYPLAPEGLRLHRPVRNFFFRTRRGKTYRGLFLCVGEQVIILRVRGPGQAELEVSELPEES